MLGFIDCDKQFMEWQFSQPATQPKFYPKFFLSTFYENIQFLVEKVFLRLVNLTESTWPKISLNMTKTDKP